MRDRPYIGAGEPARPFGEVLAERRDMDPRARRRDATMNEIERLEGEAFEATDRKERKRLQCEAEALRCGLDELPRR